MTWRDDASGYDEANRAFVEAVLAGIDTGGARRIGRARVCFALASAHVEDVLRNGYLNGYERADRRVGDPPPSDRRRAVDEAVVTAFSGGVAPEDLHYGALEVNGSGMRYYGDRCLILDPANVSDDQVVLYRNSYDLECEPIADRVDGDPDRRAAEARDLAGTWHDRAEMVWKKLHDAGGVPPGRRLTTGGLARGVIDDEDYIEVPLAVGFGARDVEEARTSAGDSTLELAIERDLIAGMTPSAAQLTWCAQRGDAAAALDAVGIAHRIVTHAGRER